ncbi:MAG: sigma-70 family RNA polymerase sigma factor [Planctomycetota bacterium]|nr:sigma-70 family RNA polymerase sigma factor [Planctomycetota bacterium]
MSRSSNNLTEKLIDQARTGDRAAFDELAGRFRERLGALVRSRLGAALRGRIEVADVLQETLLRAFRSLERFERRDDDSFLRWLGGIANNVIREVARREDRELIFADDGEEAPAPGVSPSQAGARGERFDRLQSSLDSLSPDHRRVILLARVERLPLKEVAREMNRSPEAATQLLWRALKKLKESFGSTDSFHLPDRRLVDREAVEKGGSHDETRRS